MSHIFISHATADHAVAMEVCALLEARGTKCWIGPRDVVPGKLWDEAILDAIDSTSVFLLILSSAANNAPFVKNEVNRAFTLGKPILTFRVEDVQPGRSLELYLARHHWTDGFQGRIEDRVADLARALDALPGETGSPATTSSASASASSKSASFRPKLRTLTSRRERLAWGVAAVCALGALAVSIHAGLRAGGRPQAGLSAPVFSTLDAPAGTVLVPVADHGVALSPDGRRVVFVAKPVAADRQLYLRELAEMTATVLPETVGASYPFWSPDGTQIGFFAGGKLKVVDASGGAPRILADAPNGRGGSWGQGGLIVYAPDIRSGLRVVAAVGGAPRDITRPDAGHTHRWPVVLPDGRHLLFRSSGSGSAELMLGSLDGTAPRPLIADSTNALYVHPGFILFGRGNDLFAWRFDARSLQLSGVPRSLAVGKADMFEPRGFIAFSASDSGALIFIPRDHIDRETEFRWVGRDGRPLGRVGRTDRHRWPRLSPDGERIVSVVGEYFGDADVRVTELRDQREIRLSGKARTFTFPVWSADSRTVLVGCGADLCRRSLDDGVDFRSFRSRGLSMMAPSDVSSDGRTLLFWEQSLQTGADLRRLD
ncbi:MAG: TIR domain-containing protein, partial [Gammaproteobacteria bacterium]